MRDLLAGARLTSLAMKVSSGYDAIREELSTYPVPNESGCAGFVYVVLMCCLSRETKFVRGLFGWPREQDTLTVGAACEFFLEALPVDASLIGPSGPWTKTRSNTYDTSTLSFRNTGARVTRDCLQARKAECCSTRSHL